MGDVLVRGGLVGGQAHVVGVQEPEVVAGRLGTLHGLLGTAGQVDAEGVEEARVLQLNPCVQEPDGDPGGLTVGVLGDGAQSLRSVVDGVEGGDDGQQRLSGADVGGGLLTPDVLLAGLEGQAVGGCTVGVHAHAHDASGQLALEPMGHGHEAGVGAAEEERHAQALGASDGDVSALCTGLGEQGEGQRVGVDGSQATTLVDSGDRGGQVHDGAAGSRGRQHRSEDQGTCLQARDLAGCDSGRGGGHPGDGQGVEPGGGDLKALRVQTLVQQDGTALGLAGGAGHEQAGLSHRRGLVQQRGTGHRQAGEVGYEGLEEQLGLKPALADLSLVGGVRRRPRRVGQDVTYDDGRCDRGVVAASDHLHVVVGIGGGELAHDVGDRGLAQATAGAGGLSVLGGVQARQPGRDDGLGQLFQGAHRQGAQDR